MGVEVQVQDAVLVGQCSLGPLVAHVDLLCVVGQALVVLHILVQRIAVVTCKSTQCSTLALRAVCKV